MLLLVVLASPRASLCNGSRYLVQSGCHQAWMRTGTHIRKLGIFSVIITEGLLGSGSVLQSPFLGHFIWPLAVVGLGLRYFATYSFIPNPHMEWIKLEIATFKFGGQMHER